MDTLPASPVTINGSWIHNIIHTEPEKYSHKTYKLRVRSKKARAKILIFLSTHQHRNRKLEDCVRKLPLLNFTKNY